MPIVNGTMYPEINIYPIDNKRLTILLIDHEQNQLQEFLEKLQTLRSYITDKHSDLYEFRVLVNSSKYAKEIQAQYQFEEFSIEQTKEKILEYANANDVDVIFTADAKLLHELYQGQHPHELTDRFSDLSLEVESFLTVKGIAWGFQEAAWNATWLTKYNQSDAIMQSVMKLLYKYQTTKGATQKQIDFARALTNKAGHIRHCEEMLIGYVQKKNYSKRNHSIKNSYGYEDSYDYKFELTYHLGNYYFLISGVIDIIGRLLNKTYRLGDEKNIERQEFIDALTPSNKDLADVYLEAEMNKWVVWLKKRRNYVAHESNASYSDVLLPKEVKTPEAEIVRIVEGLKDWKNMEIFVGPTQISYMKEDAKSVVRMYEDSTIYTKDAMTIPWFNQVEKKPEIKMFHPLTDVRRDYDMTHKLLTLTVDILTK